MTVLDRYLGDDRLRLVDVGARGGIAPRWERIQGVLDVTAFEPDPGECARLNREAPSLPYPIRYLPVAVGSESNDSVPFHITNWPVASSIHRPNAEFLRSFPEAQKLLEVRRIETVAITSLDDVAGREELRPDCVKIDVEGAALEVLMGAEKTLEDVLVIEVESELNPLFIREALFPQVDSFLRARGWILEGLRRTSWRRGPRLAAAESGLGGQIVSVDALYTNAALIGKGLPFARELKLLAILSAYAQIDALLERLRSSQTIVEVLDGAGIAELRGVLAPRPGLVRRLVRRAIGRVGAGQRRALADRLQRGDGAVWEDPHFF